MIRIRRARRGAAVHREAVLSEPATLWFLRGLPEVAAADVGDIPSAGATERDVILRHFKLADLLRAAGVA